MTNNKFLDASGVLYLWNKTKKLIDDKIIESEEIPIIDITSILLKCIEHNKKMDEQATVTIYNMNLSITFKIVKGILTEDEENTLIKWSDLLKAYKIYGLYIDPSENENIIFRFDLYSYYLTDVISIDSNGIIPMVGITQINNTIYNYYEYINAGTIIEVIYLEELEAEAIDIDYSQPFFTIYFENNVLDMSPDIITDDDIDYITNENI